MLRLLESVRLVSIIVSVLLATLLLFAGCDSAGIESPQKTDVEQYGPLGVAYMPYGETLLSPRELESAKTGAKSAYGCYLAERGMEPDADWNVFNIYLHFPQEMVDAAGGKVQNVVHTLENKAEKSNHQIANCYIPESEGARGLLVELLELPDDASSKSANAQTSASTSSQDDPYGLFSKRECHISEYVCIRDSDTGLLRDCIYEVKCSGSIYGGGSGGGDWGANFPSNEDSGSTSPGGGTGDDPGGSDGPGCTSQHFQPVGSSCAPPDDSDDEPEPADEPVSKAEVVDLIRDECKDAPGITLPSDDNALSAYFESSVRKSVNATLPHGRKIKYDGRGNINHPGLSLPVDGYATAVTKDGVQLSHLLSTIMEVKFTEDPTRNMDSSQWMTHINDLARSYSQLSGSSYKIAKPQYLIVTNSAYSDIGDLGGDESVRIPSFASDSNVNVMHLRVTKNIMGQFRLSGDLVGTSDTLSILADLLTDIDIPFVVECDKNKRLSPNA